jgi:hypothetical protein
MKKWKNFSFLVMKCCPDLHTTARPQHTCLLNGTARACAVTLFRDRFKTEPSCYQGKTGCFAIVFNGDGDMVIAWPSEKPFPAMRR